jgi:hypothetical protein
MNKKLKNEYTYRIHRNNCCNNNSISNLTTDFHPVIPVDELTEGSWSVYQALLPRLIKRYNNETRQ